MEAERLNMGEIVLTRILNNDADTKKIWLLGRFQRDPTDNQVVLTLSKTEFEEGSIREMFPDRQGQKRLGGRTGQLFEQYFHNSEWRKCWYSLPKELARV
mmetsp:Transcript_6797/g.8099  ORF Transcript_6797/g.8099 Transcript_6797/m.8099 type:complete len:100 (+) Transcript_6797:531-830(+)